MITVFQSENVLPYTGKPLGLQSSFRQTETDRMLRKARDLQNRFLVSEDFDNQDQKSSLLQRAEQRQPWIQFQQIKNRLEKLKKSGQAFNDQSFTPQLGSIYGEYPKEQSWEKIQWKKASEVIKNPELFHGRIQPQGLRQGLLGDCYYVAALAALAQKPNRIKNIFLIKELNQQKYVAVKMLYKGNWVAVELDQYIPWMGDKPAFSKSDSSQLWIVFLEKAWAKLYTSYKRISSGFSEEPLHDLTGAPIRYINFRDKRFNKEKAWYYLQEASNKGYSMVASSNGNSDKKISQNGIIQGHAYTILKFQQISFQGKKQKVVKCRNPWGYGQYSGRWSDSDPSWNLISESQKNRLNYILNSLDGIFYIPYETFILQLKAITVAEINDESIYVSKSAKDPTSKGVYFSVSVQKQGAYTFQVHNTPQRVFPQSIQQNYQYPNSTIKIGRVFEQQFYKLSEKESVRRVLYEKQILKRGKYLIEVKIPFDNAFEKEFEVNLGVYGPNRVKLELATQEQRRFFKENESQIKVERRKLTDEKITDCQSSFYTGIKKLMETVSNMIKLIL